MTQAQTIKDGDVVELPGHGVFLVEKGTRRPIQDPITLHSSKVNLNSVKVLPETSENKEEQRAFLSIPLGHPMIVTLPSGRFLFESETQVGDRPSHRMHTKGAFDPKTGHIVASTRTWTWTKMGGFHGAVNLTFSDKEDIAITSTPFHRYGVDGSWFGTSDRTDVWSDDISQQDAARVANCYVWHTYKPDDLQVILDKWKQAADKIADIAKSGAMAYSAISGPFKKS